MGSSGIYGFGGVRFPHINGSDSLSFKDYLRSLDWGRSLYIINIATQRIGPRVPELLEAL